MRARWIGWVGLVFSVVSLGCNGMSNTMKGGLIGAGAGAGVGTALGSLSGNPGAGAAIGAGAGTLLGGLIGNDVDQEEKSQMQGRVIQAEATAIAAQSPPLGITGVAQLAAQGHSDEVIMNQIRTTNSTFNLSTTDLQWLKESGVSDRVIAFMQTCRPTAAVVAPQRRVVVEQPVIVHESPVIYTRPYRPVYVAPPPPVGLGFTYVRTR